MVSKQNQESVDQGERLAGLSDLVGINLSQAHCLEMQIASLHLRACGDRWPRPQLLRHPWHTFNLWRMLRERNQ